MDNSPIRQDPAGAGPAQPRHSWIAPEMVELGKMSDLTLQFGSAAGGECDPDTGEGCFP